MHPQRSRVLRLRNSERISRLGDFFCETEVHADYSATLFGQFWASQCQSARGPRSSPGFDRLLKKHRLRRSRRHHVPELRAL